MSAQEKRARSEAKSILLKVGLHQSLFVMALSTGLEIGFRPHDAQGLEGARPGKLAVIEIAHRAWACISRSEMPTCTCRPCRKGFSDHVSGWLSPWAKQAARRSALQASQVPLGTGSPAPCTNAHCSGTRAGTAARHTQSTTNLAPARELVQGNCDVRLSRSGRRPAGQLWHLGAQRRRGGLPDAELRSPGRRPGEVLDELSGPDVSFGFGWRVAAGVPVLGLSRAPAATAAAPLRAARPARSEAAGWALH